MEFKVKCINKGCSEFNKEVKYTCDRYQDLGYMEINGSTHHISCICYKCDGITESADEPDLQFKAEEGFAFYAKKAKGDRSKHYYKDFSKNYKEDKQMIADATSNTSMSDKDVKLWNDNLKKTGFIKE
jgi:hypothetical protein